MAFRNGNYKFWWEIHSFLCVYYVYIYGPVADARYAWRNSWISSCLNTTQTHTHMQNNNWRKRKLVFFFCCMQFLLSVLFVHHYTTTCLSRSRLLSMMPWERPTTRCTVRALYEQCQSERKERERNPAACDCARDTPSHIESCFCFSLCVDVIRERSLEHTHTSIHNVTFFFLNNELFSFLGCLVYWFIRMIV